MGEAKIFSSLSPRLLARKGGAKPAMRPQVQPLGDLPVEFTASVHEDLGWNDMGDQDDTSQGNPIESDEPCEAEVVAIRANEVARATRKPRIVTQQNNLAERFSRTAGAAFQPSGRRAAFTLRLDPDRHLQLRMASAVAGRSAQSLLTEALDQMIEEMPQVRSMAEKVRESS